MILEWMSDPAAWVCLATLVVLEIVLGIDNLCIYCNSGRKTTTRTT